MGKRNFKKVSTEKARCICTSWTCEVTKILTQRSTEDEMKLSVLLL